MITHTYMLTASALTGVAQREMFCSGVKKTKQKQLSLCHVWCFFGRKRKTVTTASLLCRSSMGLQYTEPANQPRRTRKNCFEGVVQRQTLAISTLHFALATHTHQHTLTHLRSLCEEGLQVELCACMFVCVNIYIVRVCVRVCS